MYCRIEARAASSAVVNSGTATGAACGALLGATTTVAGGVGAVVGEGVPGSDGGAVELLGDTAATGAVAVAICVGEG